jgi:type I restriction enzyme M protein
MPSRNDLLERLTRDELLAIADRYSLRVADRRARDAAASAVAAAKVPAAALLADLSRDRLKELCRAFGLDESGREKALLIARLAGDAPSPRPKPAPTPSTAAAQPAAPAATKRPRAATSQPGANIGFEATLWQAADKLRNNMDAAEYKHVVLGLIFLKYISDAFEEKHAALAAHRATPAPTPKTRTSTAPRTSSGCRRKPAGPSCRRTRSSRRSAS